MIAIPNMEKPKSCWECRLMDGEANCLVTDEGISSKQEGSHPDCPLIDIVQCKDCKWGDTGIDEEGKPFWKCIGIHYGGTKPTDFCSYGERAE